VSAEVLAIWIPTVRLACNQRATQDGQRHAPGLSHTAKATINLSPNKSWDNAPGEIDECKKGSLHELNQEQWTFYPHQRHFREHDRALFHRVQLDLCTHPESASVEATLWGAHRAMHHSRTMVCWCFGTCQRKH
jgi:hypothetical protein